MLDRRTFLKVAVVAGVVPSFRLAWADAGAAAGLGSYTERALVNRLLSTEPAAFLAFGEAALTFGRGDTAADVFDKARQAFATLPVNLRLEKLQKQLDSGLSLDLRLPFGGRARSLGDVAGALVARTGLSLSLGTALDAIGLRPVLGTKDLAAVKGELAGLVGQLDLRPVFGAMTTSATWAASRLAKAAEESGLLGLIAGAGSTLTQLADPKIIKTLSAELTKLGDEAAKVLRGSLDLKSFPSTGQINGAIQAVGKLINASPDTIKALTKAVDVIGSAVSGAIAGASFGPIGAVVGGIVGLISSLFGGEPARDPTLEALKALDGKLTQIHADMVTGFNGLSAQLQAGFTEVNRSLAALRSELVSMLVQIDKKLNVVLLGLRAVQQQHVTDVVEDLSAAIKDHEAAHRSHLMDSNSRRYETTAATITKAVGKLKVELTTPGQGFNAPLLVDTPSFRDVTDDLIKKAGALTLPMLMAVEQRTQGHAVSPTIWARAFDGANPVPDFRETAKAFATALRHPHYQTGPKLPLGAKAIAELHSEWLPLLSGIEKSPEWKRLGREQRDWVPLRRTGNSFDPYANLLAFRPSDLQFAASSFSEACAGVTDLAVANTAISAALPLLRDRVAVHQLLTDQSLVPALLFLRRNTARQLSTQIASLYCGRAMTAARVLRAVISSLFSATATMTAKHHPPVRTKTDALQLYAQRKDLMPFGKVQPEVPTETPVIFTTALDALLPAFVQYDGTLPPDREAALSAIVVEKARDLAQLMMKDHNSPVNVLSQLESIVTLGLVLAVIETVIAIRLDGVTAAGGAPPPFQRYWDGFAEYLLLSAHALGIARVAQPDLSTLACQELIGAQLFPLETLSPGKVTDNPYARPYPRQAGWLWGWGTDDYELDDPAGDDLFRALEDPRCALACGNAELLNAAATCVSLEAARVEIDLATTMAAKLDSKQLAEALRSAIAQG